MIDERAKRAAVASVFKHLLVRATCKRDPERCGRIADTTWGCCAEIVKEATPQVGDTEMLTNACTYRVQQRSDYADTVSFIPVWLLAIILKIIIGLLIDFWFNYEKGDVV